MPNVDLLSPDQLIKNTLNAQIDALLDECSPEQVALFGRINHKNRGSFSLEDMRKSIVLLNRTVKKNHAGRYTPDLPALELRILSHYTEK